MIIFFLLTLIIHINAFEQAFRQQNRSFGTELKKGKTLTNQAILDYQVEASFLSTLSNMQYAQYNNIDPIFLWPTQPVIGKNGGNISAQPINDLMYTFPKITVKTAPIKIKNYEVSGIMTGSFGGIAFLGGLLGYEQGAVEISHEKRIFAIGQKVHPLKIEAINPELVVFNAGAPLVPCYAIHPQVQWKENFDSVAITATIMSQYLFCDNGPIGFSALYLKNSGLPQCNIKIEYVNQSVFVGYSLNYKRLVPTTSSPFYIKLEEGYQENLRGYYSSISFLISSLYGSYTSTFGTFKNQLIIGSNGTDMYLLGGYGATNYAPRDENHPTFAQNSPVAFTPIRFVDYWFDFTCAYRLWRLQPGLFCGYTQLLGSPEKLKLTDEKESIIFTIDDAAFKTVAIVPATGDSVINDKIFGQPIKHITSLLRVAPRLWLPISDKIKLGFEINIYRVIFGDLVEYSQPINTSKSIFIATTIGGQFEY
jgi:hypothetical protein